MSKRDRGPAESAALRAGRGALNGETKTQVLIRCADRFEDEAIYGKTFGSKAPLKSGRSNRYEGTVHGARDTESLDATIARPLNRKRLCPTCNIEMGKAQTDCC